MGLELSIKTCLEGFTLDVSWSMGCEMVVLFGHSGAGKSMTLRTIAGIAPQGEGYIKLNGRTLFGKVEGIDLAPRSRSVGYVFQDLALFPHMTVEQNILYGAAGREKSASREKAQDMLKLFRLGAHGKKYPGEISGGQQQRVALARALMRDPEILLLDEPFSSLDDQLRMEMRKCLVNVLREQFRIPAILVTHNVLEAYLLADRVLIYSHGRVVQTGSPQAVFNNPVNEEVISLVNLRKLYPAYLFT